MTKNDLQHNVDYFYCEECKKHVSCVRLGRASGKSSAPGVCGGVRPLRLSLGGLLLRQR